MPQAVVDPDELRQFAQKLRKFNAELRDRLTSLSNDMAALSATWRDQEHKRFADQFDEHMKLMARFLELTDRHVPYLARKADQIDEYLQS
jgi:WXG100 family type VII secretion target